MSYILLTGSSRGIGKAARAALEARGVSVIGHSTRGQEQGTIAADFTNPLAAQTLWEQALEISGGDIAAVVNNAGLFESNSLDSSDIEWLDRWEDTLRINLTASAQLSRFAVRHWHYAAAKGGMVAMHKTIARAYAGEGILSFAITPGFTDTAMAGDYLETRGGAGLLADIPLGRVAEPEEIASVIAFCALDAPPSMTGAVIDANGASYVR